LLIALRKTITKLDIPLMHRVAIGSLDPRNVAFDPAVIGPTVQLGWSRATVAQFTKKRTVKLSPDCKLKPQREKIQRKRFHMHPAPRGDN
jgi:hypothetical protein